MSRGVIRLAKNEYVEWSTVCDAPATYVLDREQAVLSFGSDRVDRADINGHSWLDMPAESPEKIVLLNRAGPSEESLTLDAIRRRYRSRKNEQIPLDPSDIAPCIEGCGTQHHLWDECPEDNND